MEAELGRGGGEAKARNPGVGRACVPEGARLVGTVTEVPPGAESSSLNAIRQFTEGAVIMDYCILPPNSEGIQSHLLPVL